MDALDKMSKLAVLFFTFSICTAFLACMLNLAPAQDADAENFTIISILYSWS